ncbi:SusE domain-containing protein [Sunxiuqinia sp. A32]|uniref:SusE domain-containing protein n=1 Tax=Sunxiuqinia sp. A32 TaxID=3461496 RepID=UPI0040452427
MKTMLIRLTILSSILLAFFGCEEEGLRDTRVTSVKTLYEPANNKAIVLQTSASASVYFEWEPAKAEDSGMVLYEVAFDVEGGDFSEPIYKLASDNNGGYNHATITHKQLNKIGAMAGIGAAETGKLIWTVFSSKGINELAGEEVRTMEITRLAGFAEVPVDVYVSGAASEGGADVADASIMKAIAPGEFEIYTQLTAGEPYYFVDSNSGTPRQFYIENNVLKEGSSSSTVETTGVYRINIDFNVGSTVLTKVLEFRLYFSPLGENIFTLDYIGNGIFKASNQPLEFKQEGWGRDERYKFTMLISDMEGNESVEWWGTLNQTDGRPTGNEEYYYMTVVPESQWDDKWKFDGIMDMAYVDVTASFNAEGPYTHNVEKVGDQ